MPQKNRTHPRNERTKEDRDPKRINEHLKIQFYDVFAERQTARSFAMCWEFTTYAYETCRDCWYGLTTIFCGCFIAMFWGCQIAVLAFKHIWFITPCSIVLKVCFVDIFQKCFKLYSDCCITPCTHALGGLFHVFHTDIKEPVVVTQNGRKAKIADRKKKPEDDTEQGNEDNTVILLPVPVNEREKSYIASNPSNAKKSIQRQIGLFM